MDSESLFQRAQDVIPGGVNSSARAFKGVGGTPVSISKACGAQMTAVDGSTLTDYCCSWGPLILGHARKEVVQAVCNAAEKGTSFGTNTPSEVEFAEFLCRTIPHVQKVRLVNSGTEAVMTALRLARGATGRRKILKFEGCYHGHVDYLLVSAGSGVLTGGQSSSAGVPDDMAGDVFVVPYNDTEAVNKVIEKHGEELAAIVAEPIAGNMGLVPPADGFLEGLRKAADKSGAMLVFDEVITGFRFGPTSFGELCGVIPDLTCLGKIIGGGMPIGAVGGRREIMDELAPEGAVYQGGTLSGNPVALAAGLTTLRLLEEENPYSHLEALGQQLRKGMREVAERTTVPLNFAQKGSVFTPFFTASPVKNLADAKASDTNKHASFFHSMLNRGIYLPPSQFELGFISTAHTEQNIQHFVDTAADALIAAKA